MKDPYVVLKHPLSTEKSVKMIESQNKLTFIVDVDATKKDIKTAIEALFKVKVVTVHTVVTPDGKKKAYIRSAPEHPALDVATQLGMI